MSTQIDARSELSTKSVYGGTTDKITGKLISCYEFGGAIIVHKMIFDRCVLTGNQLPYAIQQVFVVTLAKTFETSTVLEELAELELGQLAECI